MQALVSFGGQQGSVSCKTSGSGSVRLLVPVVGGAEDKQTILDILKSIFIFPISFFVKALTGK